MGFFLRALKICSTDAMLNKELLKIKSTMLQNGYMEREVDSIYSMALQKFNGSTPTHKEQKRRIAITFTNKSDAKKMVEITNNTKFQLIFKPSTQIHNLLPKYKDIPKSNGYIYGVSCRKCKGLYVGETGKKVELKMKQHDYAIARKDIKASALAEHRIKAKHDDFTTDSPTIYEEELH